MKKIFKTMIIVVMMVFLTGCFKFDMTMDINKDDVKIGMIYAFQKTYMNDDLTKQIEDSKESVQEQGFKIENYEDDTYKGFKATKSIGKLDDLAKGKKEKIDISKVFENIDSEKSKLFYLENGTYYANYNFNVENLDTGSSNSESDSNNNFDFDTETNDDSSDFGLDNNQDYSQLLSGIKFNFVVTLPNKSVSNNATKVSEDGKTLTWEMSYGSTGDIQFSFKTSQINSIVMYTIVGAVVGGVMGLVAYIIRKKSKNKNDMNNIQQFIQPNQTMPTMNQPFQQPTPMNNMQQPMQQQVQPVNTEFNQSIQQTNNIDQNIQQQPVVNTEQPMSMEQSVQPNSMQPNQQITNMNQTTTIDTNIQNVQEPTMIPPQDNQNNQNNQ